MVKFKLILVTALMICISTAAAVSGMMFIFSFAATENVKLFYIVVLWFCGCLRIVPTYCGGLYKILITKKFSNICTEKTVKFLSALVCIASVLVVVVLAHV